MQPLEVDLSSIKKAISYDYRRGFFGHYQVNVSWSNPLGGTTIVLLMFTNL